MLINFCPWFIMQPKLKFGNLICHAEFQFFFIKKIVAKMLTNKYVTKLKYICLYKNVFTNDTKKSYKIGF